MQLRCNANKAVGGNQPAMNKFFDWIADIETRARPQDQLNFRERTGGPARDVPAIETMRTRRSGRPKGSRELRIRLTALKIRGCCDQSGFYPQ
jgi:hypothetical protein